MVQNEGYNAADVVAESHAENRFEGVIRFATGEAAEGVARPQLNIEEDPYIAYEREERTRVQLARAGARRRIPRGSPRGASRVSLGFPRDLRISTEAGISWKSWI